MGNSTGIGYQEVPDFATIHSTLGETAPKTKSPTVFRSEHDLSPTSHAGRMLEDGG